MLELWGADLFFDGADFGKLFMRMAFDILVTAVLVRGIYYPLYKRREFVFIYFIFNLITFSLCHLLRKVPIELGFALGLFAVFGILRYRTEPIRIRDLSYLFVVIGVGILNAVSNKKISVAELLLVNGGIVFTTALLESASFGGREEERIVLYDNIELLKPERHAEFLADLAVRLGLDIQRVAIGQVDLLKDTARITVYYKKPKNGHPNVVSGGPAS